MTGRARSIRTRTAWPRGDYLGRMEDPDERDTGFSGNVIGVAVLAVLFVVLFLLYMWIADAIHPEP